MLFPRRTWSLRVTERMGLSGSSKETNLLVDLLVWSAKQKEQMRKAAGVPTLSKPEGILMGAISMVNNPSAVSKVANDPAMSRLSALRLLTQVPATGLELIKEHKFTALEQLAERRGLH